jgi:hypothetical protein
MYARIARFEAVDGSESPTEEIRERMREGKSRPEMPVQRGLMLVDREHGRGASLMFCETEEDLRRVDEYMNSMTPVPAGGRRTSVEMYEVVLDSDEL